MWGVARTLAGAFLLAEAGLLDGCRVTTHWRHADQLADEYPALFVEPDALYIESHGRYTSAGVTAGIDLALSLVEADHGAGLAGQVARELVVFLQRPGGQSQFSEILRRQQSAGPLRRFWHVTLPMLRPASLFVLVTQTIGVFQVFVVVLLLTVNGGPAHGTRTIVYGMYETAFTPMYDFDYAAAQGSVLLVALGTIAILQFRLLGRETRLD